LRLWLWRHHLSAGPEQKSQFIDLLKKVAKVAKIAKGAKGAIYAVPFSLLSFPLLLNTFVLLACQSIVNFLKLISNDVCFEYLKQLTSSWSDQWWNPGYYYLLWSRTINIDCDCQLDQLLLDPTNICINSGLPDSTGWFTGDCYMYNWIHWHFFKQHFRCSQSLHLLCSYNTVCFFCITFPTNESSNGHWKVSLGWFQFRLN